MKHNLDPGVGVLGMNILLIIIMIIIINISEVNNVTGNSYGLSEGAIISQAHHVAISLFLPHSLHHTTLPCHNSTLATNSSHRPSCSSPNIEEDSGFTVQVSAVFYL
jgi:hypothetical protein